MTRPARRAGASATAAYGELTKPSWLTATYSLLMTIKGTVVPCDGIWCATLTVQGLGSFDKGCDNTQDSTKCSVLLDPSNTFSHAGVNYTIEKVRDQNPIGELGDLG